MSDTTSEETPAAPGTEPIPFEPTNPWLTGLLAATIVIGLIGIIVFIVGASNAATFDPNGFSGPTDNGILELAIGGGLISIAITAGVGYLTARAVIWNPASRGK